MVTDPEILALRFEAGEKKAFEEVYDFFYAKLYQFSFSIIKDPEEVKDILSHAFNNLFLKHQNFNKLANIKAFLYIAVRNLSFNYLRNEKRRATRHNALVTVLGPDTTDEPEIQGRLYSELSKYVGELPERSREVITLMFYHGMKYKEIADRLGISPETVKNHRQTAISKLRKSLMEVVVAIMVLFFTTVSN